VEPVLVEVVDRLKRHIAASPDASEFCKKAVIHLIDQSRGLTRPVKMLVQSDMERRRDLIVGVHDMCSGGGTTQIDQFLEKLNLTDIYLRSWAHTPTDWGIGISIGKPYGPFEEVEYDPAIIEQIVLPN